MDTAYRSFGGEVEASSTPTICRLPDSRRHQLPAIALTFTSIAFGLVSGFVGWILTEFFAKPFRRGLDLVMEVRTQAIIFENEPARAQSQSADGSGPFVGTDATKEELEKLRVAEERYRELGAKLQAFAKTERLATWGLRLLGLKVVEAGIALVSVSNTLGVYGQERRKSMTSLEAALGIRRSSS
ncbi:hypothetical protein ACVWYH_006551 [Bradyrhizobium sp. GM24.11]